MAEGGFPNRTRADNALTIYRDAMRAYIAPILEREHGPDWIRSQVLNATARERNPSSYDRRLQSLQRGTPPRDLIDLAEIPFLIQDNAHLFPDLDQSDTRRMHMIRDLRNEIQHADRAGDCAPEEAASLAGLCTLVVERCGLSDAVENIRGLSSDEPGGGSAEADLREQRERREWDKARLAGKRPEELTPLEQQRLADIEWEEEWERREFVRREREEIARFGDDIDGLRLWFDADEARHGRHRSEHATLIQREQERREREQAEIAAFGDDLDGLRLWFDADEARRDRHRSEHATLIQREQERREREQAEIAAFGDDLDGLRRWFNADEARHDHYRSEHATLLQQEEARYERERAEIAALGGDIDGLRRWFDADRYKIRRHRYPSEYATLLRREDERAKQKHELREHERERSEIAAFGNGIDRLRRWFDAVPERKNRHQSKYAALRQREKNRQRERAEIASLGNDIDGLRRWFNAGSKRKNRHQSEYAALLRREQERLEQQAHERRGQDRLEQRERAEIAAFGDDLIGLRRWFDTYKVRSKRHPSEYAALLQREHERRERERERERQEQERHEIAAFDDDLDGLRRWFDADEKRPQRHSSEWAALTQRLNQRGLERH